MKIALMAPVALVAALSLVGCIAPGMDEGDDVGTAVEAETTENSLTSNSLTSNSLTSNSLTSNSLTSNSLTSNALTDPASRNVLTYIVGCALPAGAHLDVTISGTTYGYDGQLGLAPAWGLSGGHCDINCIQAVSSCVLSRINYLGQPVPISLRGAKLKTTPAELAAYPNIDGTYYGNIFTSPQIRLACLPPGHNSLTRVCGPSLSGCVVDVVDWCDQVCDDQRPDGSFPNCQSSRHNGVIYKSSITAFLQ